MKSHLPFIMHSPVTTKASAAMASRHGSRGLMSHDHSYPNLPSHGSPCEKVQQWLPAHFCPHQVPPCKLDSFFSLSFLIISSLLLLSSSSPFPFLLPRWGTRPISTFNIFIFYIFLLANNNPTYQNTFVNVNIQLPGLLSLSISSATVSENHIASLSSIFLDRTTFYHQLPHNHVNYPIDVLPINIRVLSLPVEAPL